MVMRRDSFASLGREVGGREYPNPIHHPLDAPAGPGSPADPNAALIAEIQRLNGNIVDLRTLLAGWQAPGNGGGSSTPALCIPTFGQAVQFEPVSLLAANVKKEITIAGCYDYCVAFCDGSTEGITVTQKTHDAAAINLGRYVGFPLLPDTTKIFVTSDVRAGRTSLVLGFTKGTPLQLTAQRQIVTAEIYNTAIVAIGTFYSTWFNYTNGRLLIDIVSTLDAACSVQLVGNISEDYTTAKNIGAPVPIAIGSVTTSGADIGLAYDDWHPYIGVVITTVAAPTAGTLVINALQLSEGVGR